MVTIFNKEYITNENLEDEEDEEGFLNYGENT